MTHDPKHIKDSVALSGQTKDNSQQEHDEQISPAEQVNSSKGSIGLGKHILLIEDDIALARVIQVRLGRKGYEVSLERNGKAGLERILSAQFDLTLLDYKLPGMDGLQIMRHLAEKEPMPPVVMLSGSGDLAVAVEAMKLGAADYVIKEVNRGYFELLESTIERCLEKNLLEVEKKEAEAHLAVTTAQLRATLTSMNQGLAVFDKDLNLVVFNEQFSTLYDFPEEMMVKGTPLVEFFAYRYEKGELGEEDREAVLARKLAEAVPRRVRIYEVHRPDNMVIEVRANPMPDGGFVSVHTDISARKKSEIALKESEDRYRRMSEFASSVIHNVGNILSSINVSCGAIYRNVRHSKVGQLTKASRLLEEHQDQPNFLSQHEKGSLLPGYLNRLSGILVNEQEETVEEVQGVLKNLLLITQIIEYQQSQGKRDELVELLDLRQVVEDALNVKMDTIMRDQVQVETHLDALLVKSQKAKLTHVLINLIKNAVEAMADNGDRPRVITIRSGKLEGSEKLFLSVADSGMGITTNNLKNLFSHGFTTKENGHGFGLHYCANTMREMNSHIEAESEGIEKGATFRLIFPANS